MAKKRLAILGLVFALTGTTVFGHCYNPSVVYAEEGTEIDVKSIDGFKNYWSFDTYEGSNVTSDAGAVEATGVLKNGATIADSGSPVFGDALWLSTANGDNGTGGNHMWLENYINTGTRDEAVSGTSFSMWYRLGENANLNGGSMVLLQPENNGNYTGRTILSLETNRTYKTNLAQNGNDTHTINAVDPNVWQHITVVFDNNTEQDKVYFYVNGTLDNAVNINYDNITNTVLNLRLGAHRTGGNSMCGYIDEFYVFEKALTAEEAKAVYNEKANELAHYEECKTELAALITEADALCSDKEAEVAKGGVLDQAQEATFEAVESAIAGGNAVA